MENLILLLTFIFCLSFVFTIGALCETLITKRTHAKHAKLNGFIYKL
jgi:uncharacterized BrkB/YihY/UPF0761 family membrane protein